MPVICRGGDVALEVSDVALRLDGAAKRLAFAHRADAALMLASHADVSDVTMRFSQVIEM